MKTSIYLIAIITLLFSACKNEKKQTKENHSHSTEMKMEDEHSMDNNSTENSTNISLTDGIVDSYIMLKNALVDDNNKKAVESGEKMLKAISNFNMSKLSEEQHSQYMEIAESSKEHAEHIIKSDIGHQREHFESLSTDINDLIALLGTQKTLYQDFCPMYNNNKGGMWLSESEEIRNPYFGSRMMNCGKIQKKIN